MEILSQVVPCGLATKLLRSEQLLISILASVLCSSFTFLCILFVFVFFCFYHIVFFHQGPRGECDGLKLEDKGEREDFRKYLVELYQKHKAFWYKSHEIWVR